MKLAHAGMQSQFTKTWQLIGAFDEAAGFLDFGCVQLRQGQLIRPATLARAEACLFRILAGGMKLNILRPSKPSGARRTAVDARRLDGVIELGGLVTRQDRCPASVVCDRFRERGGALCCRFHNNTLSGNEIPKTPFLAFKITLVAENGRPARH